MSRNRIAAAAAAAATVGVLTGCAAAHHGAAAATTAHTTATHTAATHTTATHTTATHTTATHRAATHAAAVDPAAQWLESRGGQAQVTFNTEVDTLAGDLETENYAPTVANHLIFEADARVVRAEARKILSTPSLQPTVNRAGYQEMLNKFITVADLLQPGAGYGTTPQDYTAWNAALRASTIVVW